MTRRRRRREEIAISGPSNGQIQCLDLDFPIMELVSAELAVALSAGRPELSCNSELDCCTFHTVALSLGLGELVSCNRVLIFFCKTRFQLPLRRGGGRGIVLQRALKRGGL